MKVLLVLNKPTRELPVMEAIKKEILSLDPDAEVSIREMCVPGFNSYVLKFKPHVILTFPFTCVGFSTWYYFFKLLFRPRILSLRAEGVINLSSEFIQLFTGFDVYGKYLVDYELFWGTKTAQVIGRHLLHQNKISSLERIKCFGYSRLESYFNKTNEISNKEKLPSRIRNTINNYSRKEIVLFITGFAYSNYTGQNLIDAKDLNAENRMDDLLKEVEFAKKYKQEWVNCILQVADGNPQLLFVVKKHPTERKEDYPLLENKENILFLYEDIDIQDIMNVSGLYIHYGSTSLVDAYLSKVPSVYAYPRDIQESSWYSDLGWPSTKQVLIEEITSVVKEYAAGKLSFTMTREIQELLRDNFNIEEGKPYKPSRDIAQLILTHERAQKIPLTDIYLWKSLGHIFVHGARSWFARLIKKLLKMDPSKPLLKNNCSFDPMDH